MKEDQIQSILRKKHVKIFPLHQQFNVTIVSSNSQLSDYITPTLIVVVKSWKRQEEKIFQSRMA